MDFSHGDDFGYYQKIQYSHLIVCCSTFKGNLSLRNCLSKCLHRNLLKNAEHKHLQDILVDVNISMKQNVDLIRGYEQAVEYRSINMNKKLYLMCKDGKTFCEREKKGSIGI